MSRLVLQTALSRLLIELEANTSKGRQCSHTASLSGTSQTEASAEQHTVLCLSKKLFSAGQDILQHADIVHTTLRCTTSLLLHLFVFKSASFWLQNHI